MGQQKRTITERVYEQMRDAIRSGELTPGERLDQAGLARQFGTSIVPVREALARLQADGLVRIVPHRGAFVQTMSPDALMEVYAMRELLEEDAARLAAPHLSDQELARLARLVDEMAAATLREDYGALFQSNRDFHFTIYHAARRPNLLQVIEQLWNHGDHYRRSYTQVPERARQALEEHRVILAACGRRDPDALGLMIRHHVHQTTVGLLEHISALVREEERHDSPTA
jgi:DNA-binding GntR family transcriptional regulator